MKKFFISFILFAFPFICSAQINLNYNQVLAASTSDGIVYTYPLEGYLLIALVLYYFKVVYFIAKKTSI